MSLDGTSVDRTRLAVRVHRIHGDRWRESGTDLLPFRHDALRWCCSAPRQREDNEVSAVPSTPVLSSNEPPVIVSMCDDHVVIAPSERLDVTATEALIGVAASAVRSGAVVMLDLDPRTPSDDLIRQGPVARRNEHGSDDDNGPVQLIGPGCVRFATADSFWTIDLVQSRLLRSEKPVELCFVGVDRWTPIRAVWIDCTLVTALTDAGTYLSCRAAWAPADAELAARLAG
jgi:hypothetical protein